MFTHDVLVPIITIEYGPVAGRVVTTCTLKGAKYCVTREMIWLFCDAVLTSSAGQERLPGFPSQAETVARWEELTGRRGAELHWFLVFAGLRFTVVMLRLGTLLHDMGVVPESFGYDNDICRALDELLLDA